MAQIGKKTMLLHACCGPCSSACLERLYPDFDVTVFYYNPNIADEAEYRLREAELKRFLLAWRPQGCEEPAGFALKAGRYNPQEYYTRVKGLEQEAEGGERCRACILLRLEETAKAAREGGFDCFDTTLTVSPHKNYDIIAQIGGALQEQYGVTYAAGNYKKQDGYRRSVELSRAYGLYRQDYCGCVFSKEEAERRRVQRRTEAGL